MSTESLVKTLEQLFASDADNFKDLLEDAEIGNGEVLSRTGLIRAADNISWIAHQSYMFGDLDEAERLLREAMFIYDEIFGPRYPGYAMGLNNLAMVSQSKGELDEAERLYRAAMFNQAETVGVWHPDYAMVLNNLASMLVAKGELDEAERLYRNAIAIFDEKFGPDHPDTQRARSYLAALHDTP